MNWPHPAEKFLVDPGKAPEFNDKDGSCAQLNRLEAEVAASLRTKKVPDATLGEYEKHLQQWRRGHPGHQPSCRTEALGKLLCIDGADLNDLMPPPTDDPWDGWMRDLASHENATEHCQAFEANFVPKWEPHVFHWGEQVPEAILDEILADPEYAKFASAMHLAPAYGAPQVMFRQRAQGRFRMARAEHLNQFRMLRKVVPGIEVTNLKQLVEFGGGCGDVPAMYRDLGFAGTHFVYDFPPMLLMQRYWLQYSGLPAYLGKDLANAKSASGKTVLVSTYSNHLSNLLDKDALRDSLFLATFSLTEADLASRQKIWNDVKDFGIIFILFWKEWYGIDNMRSILDLTKHLHKTHSLLLWPLPRHWHATNQEALSLVAVRHDRGKVECVAEMACSPDSRIPLKSEL
jgi:hypothetical protein